MNIVVLVTAKDETEAGVIAQGLVEAQLAACVNIVSGVESKFWWDGKVDTAQEVLLVIKTAENLFEQLTEKVEELHSYDVPEVIALPIVKGSEQYLKWINDSVKK